jgi:hypothetical protein
MEHRWNNSAGENQSNRRKICPIATLFTNITCTGLESNSGLNVERPTTNRQSHCTFFEGWNSYKLQIHKITFSPKHVPPYLPEAPLLATGTESHPGCQFEIGSWLIRWLVLICVKYHDKRYTETCWCCGRLTSLVLVLRVVGSAGWAHYVRDKNNVASTLFWTSWKNMR